MVFCLCFYKNYLKDEKLYENSESMFPKGEIPSYTFSISIIPWVNFTGFNLNIYSDGSYLLPVFTFGKYVKNLVLDGEMKAEEGLKIIGNIFDSLNKFRNEEDKRLLGYVVLNSLIKTAEKTKEVVVEKQIIYKEIPKTDVKNEKVSETREDNETAAHILITIDEVQNKWKEIVRAARNEKMTFSAFLMDAVPQKVEDSTLFVRFNSNLFAKEQMETEYYNSIFQEVVERIMGSRLKVKYLFKENRNEGTKSDNDFTSQLMTYFSEEN